jgi:hypothetical protein
MADNKTQVVITAKDETASGFASAQAGLTKLAGGFAGLANPIAQAGTAITAAAAGLVASVKSAIDTGDQFSKLSQKTGIAVESLSALAYAGDLSGVSIDALANGIKKLSVNMSDAAGSASGKAAEAFKALGVSVTDSNGALRSSEAVIADIAEKFAGMKDGAGKTALAVALFGKAGSDLIPLLNSGSKGLAEMTDEAQKLGLVMTGKTAKSAEEFNDNVRKLALSTSALGRSIAADLLGPLAEYTRLMVEARKEGAGFFTSLVVGLRTGDMAQKSLDELRERAGTLQGTVGNLEAGGVGKTYSPIFSEKLRAAKAELAILQKEIRARIAQGDEVIPPFAAGEKADAPKIAGDASSKPARKKTDLDRMLELGQRNLAAAKAAEFSAADDDEESRLAAGKTSMRSLELAKKESDAAEALRQKYIELADPLQKYRVQLDQINQLRASGQLTAAQALEAEWKVNEAMDETANKLTEVKDAGTDTFADLTRAVEGWGNAFTDTLADMVMGGKASFADLANSIIRDLLRIQIQRNITKPLMEAGNDFLGSLFKSTVGSVAGGYGDTAGLAAGVPQYAQGTPFVPNDGMAYLHRGEAVIPADQNRGGGMTVNIIEDSSRGGQVQQRQQGGESVLDVFVERVKSAIAGDIARGSGAVPSALESTYGMNRAAGAF